MGRLADKNILITGGNSGIGLATAQEFDREGARVAICGLNERTLQAAKETLGAGSLAVRADVSKLADLDTMFATIKREFGHLDGLFVNAGYSEFLPFEEVTEQSFDMVIGSNFKGAYFTIQKALPLLRPGSSVDHQCVRWRAQGVADDLDRLDLQGRGRPSRANPQRRTHRPRDSREYPKPRPDGHGDVRSLSQAKSGATPSRASLRTNNPSKRMADPLEIAKLAVYLASDDSAYVVGADFLIDGGVTAISGVGA